MDSTILVVILSFQALCTTECNCANILLVPFAFQSHVSQLTNIGLELANRGHEVSVLLPPTYPYLQKVKDMKNIEILLHKNAKKDAYDVMNEAGGFWDEELEAILRITLIEEIRSVEDINQGWVEFCINPLKDKELHRVLKAKKFDVAILDAFQESRCLSILLYKLDLPIISVLTVYEPWLMRNPALPSFVPGVLSPPTTPKMTFSERLQNLWTQLDWTINPNTPLLNDDLVKEYVPEKAQVSINDILRQSLLWLIDTDPIIDYARPNMANEVFIGGLTAKPGKSLPSDIDKFMSTAKKGVIVVSFGSMEGNLPMYVVNKLMAALVKTGLSVIWRYPHKIPDDLPDNFKLLSWMPQNDILAHPNVKLFITHCGNNGQFESLYHAVPMIGMPMFGDQKYNALRIKYHNYGEHVVFLDFTAEELFGKIKKVLGNSTYYKNIKRASEIFKSRPMTPKEVSVYWIEHVLKYGADYLHSYALDMPWYEYLMLDIAAFVLAMVLVVSTLLIIFVKYVSSASFSQRVIKNTKKNE